MFNLRDDVGNGALLCFARGGAAAATHIARMSRESVAPAQQKLIEALCRHSPGRRQNLAALADVRTQLTDVKIKGY